MLATAREAYILAEQEDKLATRTQLKQTKAMEAAWSKNSLPTLGKSGH